MERIPVTYLPLIKNSGDELPKARSLPLAGVNPLDLSMGI